MKISVKDLKAKQACADQVELFEKTFGHGPVNVTKANCLKAAKAGLDFEWAAGRFLSRAAWADYKKAGASALVDYDKALALAFWRASKIN